MDGFLPVFFLFKPENGLSFLENLALVGLLDLDLVLERRCCFLPLLTPLFLDLKVSTLHLADYFLGFFFLEMVLFLDFLAVEVYLEDLKSQDSTMSMSFNPTLADFFNIPLLLLLELLVFLLLDLYFSYSILLLNFSSPGCSIIVTSMLFGNKFTDS